MRSLFPDMFALRLPFVKRPARYAARMVLLAACLAVFLSGCGGARYASGPEYSPRLHDYLCADDTAAFDACVAACMENTALALVTRAGCLEGCAQARASFPLHDKVFSSRDACLDALLGQEMARETRIRDMRRWCDAQWTHVHNRKGCYRAAEAFYASLEPATVCGGNGEENAAYGEALARARETAALPPEESASEHTAPEARPAPAPLPPASLPEEDITRSTQPAGPVEPPSYTPRQESDAPSASPDPVDAAASATSATSTTSVDEPRPYIRDTPKYQKQTPRPVQRKPLPPGGQSTTPKALNPAEAQTKPQTVERKTTTGENAATTRATPASDSPAASGTAVPGTLDNTPPEPALPPAATTGKAPEAQRTPDQAKVPAPGAETNSRETPLETHQQPPAPDPVPPAPGLPATDQAAPTEEAATPVHPQDQATTPPDMTQQRPVLPPPHLPMPPESSREKDQAAQPDAVMPPLPSMLHQPYAVPTLISPQIAPPDEEPGKK